MPATRAPERSSPVPTRERILSAALELFAHQGFDATSTAQIEQAAGLSPRSGALYKHFRSKEELWHAAVDSLFELLQRTMAERTAGLRGVDQVTTAKLLVREFVTFSARNPQLHRIITQECKSDGPRMDWMVERHVRPRYEQTTAMLAALVRAGHLPDVPVAHLYYILTGAGPTTSVSVTRWR